MNDAVWEQKVKGFIKSVVMADMFGLIKRTTHDYTL